MPKVRNKHKARKEPTKFSKKIVIFCISVISIYTIVSTYLNYKLSLELSPTLTTCVYAFFGTELAASAIIRVFDKEDAKDKKKDEEKYEEVSSESEG